MNWRHGGAREPHKTLRPAFSGRKFLGEGELDTCHASQHASASAARGAVPGPAIRDVGLMAATVAVSAIAVSAVAVSVAVPAAITDGLIANVAIVSIIAVAFITSGLISGVAV